MSDVQDFAVRNNSQTEDKWLVSKAVRWVFVGGFKSHYFKVRASAKLSTKPEGRSYSAIEAQPNGVPCSSPAPGMERGFRCRLSTNHQTLASAQGKAWVWIQVGGHQMESPKGQGFNCFVCVCLCVFTHTVHVWDELTQDNIDSCKHE